MPPIFKASDSTYTKEYNFEAFKSLFDLPRFTHVRPKSGITPLSSCFEMSGAEVCGYHHKSSTVAKQLEIDRTEKLCFQQGNHLVP